MFTPYNSKPVTRQAYEVKDTDVITKLGLSVSSINDIEFKHYEPVKPGDFIVRLTEEDTYHCSRAVFLDRNITDVQVKVSYQHITELLASLEYKFTRVEGTTKTICTAILPNGFMVGSGESACVVPEEFNQLLGEQYAKERAMADATNELWKLEGYLLKVTGVASDAF